VVYNLILSYSRRKFYWASLSETQESVFEAVERGFHHFRGAPVEILVDNARVFVKNARPSNFEWNPHFLEFCRHYRVIPQACQVRRAKTKGKVERPFYFLEQHFIKGREFVDFSDFARKLSDFNMEIDHRIHQTLGVTPIDRFEEERDALSPLPPDMWFGAGVLFRKVSWDCLISFDGSRYSVPFQFAGKEVRVKISRGIYVEIYSMSGDLIATHKLSGKKGSITIDKSHYEGLKKQSPRTLANLKRVFAEEFPEDVLFMEKLLSQYKWNAHSHLRNILELLVLYPKEKIRETFPLAMSYNTFSSHFIRGVLEKEKPGKPESPIQTMVEIPRIHIGRSLKVYDGLVPRERRD
jgi:hypothetical protein